MTTTTQYSLEPAGTSAQPQTQQMRGPVCHTRGCRGYGDPTHGVVLVGIAPGGTEMERGRPFMGPSGNLMDKILATSGWPRSKTYATNLICWWNNSPTPEEILRCNERLVSELTLCEPRLIISLGQIVTSRLTGIDPKTKRTRGSVLWSDEFKCYVLTTNHPAAVLRSQSMDMAQSLLRDFDKIPLVLDWPMDGSIADVRHRVVVDPVEAQAMLDSLPTDGKTNVVVDIETNSKTTDEADTDVFTEELLRIGFRWVDAVTSQECICVFRPGAWAQPLSWPERVRWEFQFGVYDTMGLWRHLGVRLPIVEDLGIKSYAVDERSGQHGLKTLAREYQGAGWYDAPLEADKKRGTMDRLPPEVVDDYNAKDVAYTGRTDPILSRFMEREGTSSLYYDLLIPAYNVYRDSQFRGINVDHRKLIELGWETWMPRWIEMEDEMIQEASDLGFVGAINLNSTQNVGKLFFQIIGLESKKKTPTGRPSVDKFVMDSIDHPFAAKIRAFRALDGIMDYVFAIQYELKLDGRLHPSAQMHTVRTGRRSYKRPAMQTIPEEFTVGAEYAQIQEVFIPHNPRTHGMLKVDYEQIEVWAGWALSRDPVLLEHLLSGDVHSATAEVALGVDRRDYGFPNHRKNPVWEDLRQNAKKIRFGLQFGEGADSLSRPRPIGMGCTPRQAQDFIDNYWAGYRVYAQWVKATERLAASSGELVTPTGRKMHFPIIMDLHTLRQAINFPIQSPASDHVLISLIELAERLKEFNSYFLIDIHDAMWVEYDLRFEAQVCRLVREVMERPKWAGWPNVPVEIKIGPNIGKLTRVPREWKWELQCAP